MNDTRTSYLTADELQAVQTLHKRSPYVITGISRSMFSVARHFGVMKFQGCHYTYMGQEFDECVRDDVLHLAVKLRRKPATNRDEVAVAVPKQVGLI